MTITDDSDGTGFRVVLEVFDPRLSRSVARYVARNQVDVNRVKRAYMGKYRIPPQKVTIVEKKAAPKAEEMVQ